MSTILDRIRLWFDRTARSGEEAVEGSPVTTPPAGATADGTADADRETSTNAQMEGAADEPWPGNT